MIPQPLPLESFTEGDEWAGLPALTIRVNGAPPPSPLARATLRFKAPHAAAAETVELSSATPGQLTIVSAANWEISVPPQLVEGLKAGRWGWRLRCWDSTPTGSPQTYLADELTVLESI